MGKVAKRIAKVAGPVGDAVDVISLVTATTTEEQVQASSDVVASGVGYAGPVGAAFTTAYGAMRFYDETAQDVSISVVGTDLSPSGLTASHAVTADRFISSMVKDDPQSTSLGYDFINYFGL